MFGGVDWVVNIRAGASLRRLEAIEERPLKKSFALGCLTGALLLVVLEVVTFFTGAHWYARLRAKNPDMGLKPPAIPATLDADFSLALETLDGAAFDMAALKGRALFITFWRPNCGACLIELPSLQRLYEMTRDGGVEFAAVAMTDDREEVEVAVAEHELTFPVYVYPGKRPDVFHTGSVPATFLIAPDGKIAFRHAGPAKWDGETTAGFLRSVAAQPPEL